MENSLEIVFYLFPFLYGLFVKVIYSRNRRLKKYKKLYFYFSSFLLFVISIYINQTQRINMTIYIIVIVLLLGDLWMDKNKNKSK